MNSSLDILKYVMSIFIIMLHAGWATQIIVTRVAVPVFFILSSYFFFKKIEPDMTKAEIGKHYKHFLGRSLKLYLFWFIVLIPRTVEIRGYFSAGMTPADSVIALLRDFFFQSTFPASWYISALVIGIAIALLLRKHEKLFLMLALVGYFLCCLCSNYLGVAVDENWTWVDFFVSRQFVVFTSFPAGLFFIFIGKKIRCHDNIIRPWIYTLWLLGALAALFIENGIIEKFGWRYANDCYLSLMILAPAIVLWVMSLNLRLFDAEICIALRKMSTIYYCSHLMVIHLARTIIGPLPVAGEFSVTLAVCTILAVALIYYSKRPRLRILRYSY